MALIYAHRRNDTNIIFYVGSAVTKSEKTRPYATDLRGKHWLNIYNKFGRTVEILEANLTDEEVYEREIFWISLFGRKVDGGSLINLTKGGKGSLGVKMTKEQKQSIADRVKAQYKDPEFYAKWYEANKATQTPEAIAKRTESLKGRTHTEQAKANFKAAQNRPEVRQKQAEIKKSEEWLTKQRNAKLGRVLTAEHKAKISDGLKGRTVTDEVKQKISFSNSGKVRTEEQKKKLSESRKGKPRNPKAVIDAAESNKKILLNTATGIYYNGMKEAAESIPMNVNTFRAKMAGHIRNNTSFVYS